MLTITIIEHFLIAPAELWQLTKKCDMNFANRLLGFFIYQILFTPGALINWATHQFTNVSFNKDEIFMYFNKLLEFHTRNLNVIVPEESKTIIKFFKVLMKL